jgi:kynurenine formamidase
MSFPRFTLVRIYGTHIDAPRHFLKEGQTIADFKVDRFSGSALCIVRQLHHVSALDLTDAEILRIKDLKPEFLLIRTGFDQNWGKPVYFQAHPYLSLELARQLIALNVSGIGMGFSERGCRGRRRAKIIGSPFTDETRNLDYRKPDQFRQFAA